MYATDGQTGGQTKATLIATFLYGHWQGHNKTAVCSRYYTVETNY